MSRVSAAAELLSWYERHRRELPWRRDRDAYRVWISEIMLQQTRVETVLPYYRRFLERFPTVEALAAAPVDEVLARWSGLGYYRRARQLHAAAGRIAREGFPRTAAALAELPGIGPYTAAAIASIAFGESVPVVDGNVERVVARRLALAEDPKRAAARRLLREAAGALVDPARPGDSNQALMEVGATICTPRRPRCLLCPLASGCRAREEGDPERYPVARKRRAPERVRRVVAWVERDGRHLLFRRPGGEELLAGFWELPWWEPAASGPKSALDRPAARAAVEGDLGRRYGGRWQLGEAVGRARHSITYRAFELEVRRASVARGGEVVAEGPEGRWFSAEELESVPTSSMVGKVLAAVAGR